MSLSETEHIGKLCPKGTCKPMGSIWMVLKLQSQSTSYELINVTNRFLI